MNIGVAAHVTAAASGGPRYDAALTPKQRSSARNGIWLCHVCAAHIDRDDSLYTTPLLHQWKASGEAYAKSLLLVPGRAEKPGEPVLDIPSTDAEASWLPFSARVSAFVGRDDEYTALMEFLQGPAKLAWWQVTGPAGSGKSRLALELCLAVRPMWNAGFLARDGSPIDWLRFRPDHPTLVVVDYVATRAAEISTMVLHLCRSAHHLPHPVRVLLLEREGGSWSSRFMREDSHSETVELVAKQHADPLALAPMSMTDLYSIASDVARHHGTTLAVSVFAVRMRIVDPLGRPLFGMLAADGTSADGTSADGTSANGAGDLVDKDVLQTVVNREVARWRRVFANDEHWRRMQHLLTLATMVGGIRPRSGGFEFLSGTGVSGLLPDLSVLEPEEYEAIAGARADTTLPGLQPDIVGERFVLDCLAVNGIAGQPARRLLHVAATVQPDDLCAFIIRAVQDFPDDGAVDVLITGVPRDTDGARARWGTLVADLVLAVHRSADGRVQSLVEQLRALSGANPEELLLRNAVAGAEFNLGNVLLGERKKLEAVQQYERALAVAASGSELVAAATNNRGVVHQQLYDEARAVADWDDVIAMGSAPAEARACALNNRADVHARHGDHEAAVRDRTAVLNLPDTTYNRRFIALSRRSRSWIALGHLEDALRDLAQILRTEDISEQQKASAMIDRGRILIGAGRLTEARADFERVLDDELVFPGAHAHALVGLGEIARIEHDSERCLEYLAAAVNSREIDDQSMIEIFAVRARVFEDAGDTSRANGLWERIARDPRSSALQKRTAQKQISSAS